MSSNGRSFWGDLFKYTSFTGTDDSFHSWLDMNEPSVFDGPEGTLPRDALFNLDNVNKVQSKDVRNLYGLKMTEATYNSLIRKGDGRRPFILTRSAFFGT